MRLLSVQMAKGMCMWLLSTTHDGTDHDSEYALSKNEILHIWVRVALARELNTSCKFESQVGLPASSETGSITSSVSSHATGATGGTGASRGHIGGQPVRRGSGGRRSSTIMPFRADSPESLFLS